MVPMKWFYESHEGIPLPQTSDTEFLREIFIELKLLTIFTKTTLTKVLYLNNFDDFVERKCWISTFKVGYNLLLDTLGMKDILEVYWELVLAPLLSNY